MQRTKQNRKFIISVVMTLMLIASMMPGMAFADTGSSVTITNPPETAKIGIETTMTADYTIEEGVTAHLDWSVEDGTGSAFIGKHNGKLVGNTAGTVTVTASLKTGTGTGGSGDGTGGGESTEPCPGEVIASHSVTVTILENADYGYQGEGGNTLLLEQVSGTDLDSDDVTFWGITENFNDKNLYNNEIYPTVTATNNTISFGYTMSAGINNFKESTFNTYKGDINIYNADTGAFATEISYGGFANRIVTINADVSSLSAGNYILRFGPSVCGNNSAKNLDCYIDFEFTLDK